MAKVAPSILAANFSRLAEEVALVAPASDRLHIDVMDGHFVSNLSMGAVVVEGLRPVTRLPLEVHLMVEDPEKFIPGFHKAGADTVIFHLEVVPDPAELIRLCRGLRLKVGLAVNPDVPVARFAPHVHAVDLLLVMTVFPGFGGQAFLPESSERVSELARLIRAENAACELEVDGGIDLATAEMCVRAGATVLVAGTSVFKSPDPLAAATAMRDLPGPG